MKPDKIILWLGREKFPYEKLPRIFDTLRACGVEVKFREDVGPHTKYFHAMQEYPEDIIVTFDDDTLYKTFVLEKLYESYKEHTSCVSAMRSRKINFKHDGTVANYCEFGFEHNSPAGVETFSYLPEGICGVLYPPHCLHKEAFNVEMMQKLCPKQDDIWLFIMEVLNGTKSVSACENPNEALTLENLFCAQATALWKNNCLPGSGNDYHMRAILDAYSDWRNEDGKSLLELIRES